MRVTRNHFRRTQWPVPKQCFAVNILFRYQPPNARIAGVIAIITHHKIITGLDVGRWFVRMRHVQMRIEITLVQVAAVDSHLSVMNFDSIAGQTDHALDITLRRIFRKPKHHDVGAINFRGPAIIVIIDQFVYEDALRKGRTVIIALADDETQAEAARKELARAGAESIDAAREEWWIGLRSAEEEEYLAQGRNFKADESVLRRGFEAALLPETRNKSYSEASDYLRGRYGDVYNQEPFRHG